MRIRLFFLFVFSLSSLLFAVPTHAQEQALYARQRVFLDSGSGVRAMVRGPDGHYFILSAPASAVQMFDASGKRTGQVPEQTAGPGAIVFGNALDVDAMGRVYVADRGGNAVNVYAVDGSLLAHIRVDAPVSVAALPQDEFAVTRLNGNDLITVYDLQGTLLREFGDLADFSDDPAFNHVMNLGRLRSDTAGNLYFAFEYLPQPVIRKYDSYGYLTGEFPLDTPEAQSIAQDARDQLARAAKRGAAISPREIISGMGVDTAAQEVWVALGSSLIHLDRQGKVLDRNRTYTNEGAPLTPDFIFVEPTRLLLGSDPEGIFEMVKPAPRTQNP